MKTLLISLHPRHSQNILSGKKILELRKKFPDKISEVFFYETVPTKAIVGKFKVHHVYRDMPLDFWIEHREYFQLTPEEISCYLKDKYTKSNQAGCAVQVIDVEPINPVSLEKMKEVGINPPQSYTFLSPEILEQLGIKIAGEQ